MLLVGIIKRDVTSILFRSGQSAAFIGFFVMSSVMMAFALKGHVSFSHLGYPTIWVCALLASLLMVEVLYKDDAIDGTLDQFVLYGKPLWHIMVAKLVVHWCVTGVPILCVFPIIAVMFHVPLGAESMVSLLLGTVLMSMISHVVAILSIGIAGRSSVIAVAMLPLYVPVIIFGVNQELLLSLALIMLLLPTTLLASYAALKAQL
tara:strand:- start:357 stop:971 length:615 start_codon:yes stop_codon:yes gene_type:complete